MKVVLSWLREFCPTDLPADELAEALTAVGVKVEEILRPWDGLSGVVVAEVLEVADHPDSDKLCVTRVRTTNGEATVVAGVRNMEAGDLVPYAPPGSRVPLLPDPLEVRSLRGVESEGMLCSPRELNVADVHTGIMVLPSDSPLGADVGERFGLADAVLDIEIEPNRPDLMSVIGVAREASAVTGVPLTIPDAGVSEGEEPATDVARVEVVDLERCPYYLARVIRGVGLGESPVTAQARLTAAGMRPISNVVDATNYILLEVGHPLHPFDLSLLDGASIIVRRAEEGEELTTLDGVIRSLTGEDLLIADRSRGVAVAGVMGSAAAEVSQATTDVLLESAYFQPGGILRTARRLGLSTEASMRFERGADPEAVAFAAGRAAHLIAEWSGGTVLAGAAEAGSVSPRRHVSVRPQRASAVLGTGELTGPEVGRRLASVGFVVQDRDDVVDAEVPSFRVDVQCEIDLIEEIVRVDRGYERIGATLPEVRQPGGMPPPYAFRRRLRELLVRQGLAEVRSLSFASAADLDLMGDPPDRAIRLANPLSAEEGSLRTRLTPGLLRALQHNQARNVLTARVFEVGTVFRAGAPVDEVEKVGFAITGPASHGWSDPDRELDFFDARGIVEVVLEGLGVRDWTLGEPAPMPFHPGRSATVTVAGRHAGLVGELHPRVAADWDLSGRVAIAVLAVEALRSGVDPDVAYAEVPRFPPARRDLAFIVREDVPAGDLRSALLDAGGEVTGSVELFDVFAGGPIPEGKRNLAFSVDFRVPDRTLTDDEVDEAVARIATRLAADFGAELRG
ncbi:MAG: phenylalanine--tRNA ligase subunit beta [Actinomycetota bacterium]